MIGGEIMNSKKVVGVNVKAITQKLASAIASLPSNKIAELNSNLSADVRAFLSHPLQKIDTLFGLRLTLKKKPSMAHSGWLHSRYLEACRKSKVDPATTVTLYSKDLFTEFEQFSVLDSEALFLGFNQNGAKMLEVILQAELHFDPNDFDIDGYAK